MIASLKSAFDQVSKLPEAEQEAMAAIILEKLESERRWDESFAKSKGMLTAMANEALREFRADADHAHESEKS